MATASYISSAPLIHRLLPQLRSNSWTLFILWPYFLKPLLFLMLSCLLASLHNADNCEDTARHAFAFRWISFTVIVSRELLISGTVIFLETVYIERLWFVLRMLLFWTLWSDYQRTETTLYSHAVYNEINIVSCSAYVVDFVLSIQQSGLELSVVMLCFRMCSESWWKSCLK